MTVKMVATKSVMTRCWRHWFDLRSLPARPLLFPGRSADSRLHASGLPWTIVVLLTLLTLLPALLLSMTPLLRLLVIFHFLRQALGTQTVPTNQTLVGLSLVLTYFLMQPVGAAIYQQAWFRWRQSRLRFGKPSILALNRCGISC